MIHKLLNFQYKLSPQTLILSTSHQIRTRPRSQRRVMEQNEQATEKNNGTDTGEARSRKSRCYCMLTIVQKLIEYQKTNEVDSEERRERLDLAKRGATLTTEFDRFVKEEKTIEEELEQRKRLRSEMKSRRAALTMDLQEFVEEDNPEETDEEWTRKMYELENRASVLCADMKRLIEEERAILVRLEERARERNDLKMRAVEFSTDIESFH
ncbi:uncharacterized protein PAC_07381 [Phialocephala subalpina]|uniref:Uncharacterized protein n=1 Tax=Phialocephala subalpina TaxID=576137 RepID=A0A1L7WXJ4_9HELO|nr:uncharacterized protein PAC_07381 [Phialocephala subalpina]